MSEHRALTMRGWSKSGLPVHTIRHAIEVRIERLIGILDAIDGDVDEEDADHPEDDAGDARELDEDREPALGWTDSDRQTFGPARYGDVSVWDEDEQ